MVKDFSKCKLSNKRYGGSERKIGIILDNDKYMLKFQKIDDFGNFRNNHISEYLGSHIFKLFGFKVHDTILGIYKNCYVVACKDFLKPNQCFVPFNDVGESSLDTDIELYQYSYENIVTLLESNKKLTGVADTIDIFFKIYIVDALIGNFDRHGANWGFIKENNQYSLAPVFDNGSSLFPNLIDENMMQLIMNSEEETNSRVYKFPTSQIKIDGVKSSYFDVISSLKYSEINKALVSIYDVCNIEEIFNLIDDIEIINDVQKRFYKHIIKNRYEKIIKFSYDKLQEQNK